MRTYRRDGKLVVRFTRRDVAVMLLAWGAICLLFGHLFKRDLQDFLHQKAQGGRFEKPVVMWILRDSDHPVVRDIAWGRFKAGDPATDLLARHPSARSEVYGPYTRLCYFPKNSYDGLRVIVKDGCLVSAESNYVVYFDTLGSTDRQQLFAMIFAERSAEFAARNDDLMAVEIG